MNQHRKINPVLDIEEYCRLNLNKFIDFDETKNIVEREDMNVDQYSISKIKND